MPNMEITATPAVGVSPNVGAGRVEVEPGDDLEVAAAAARGLGEEREHVPEVAFRHPGRWVVGPERGAGHARRDLPYRTLVQIPKGMQVLMGEDDVDERVQFERVLGVRAHRLDEPLVHHDEVAGDLPVGAELGREVREAEPQSGAFDPQDAPDGGADHAEYSVIVGWTFEAVDQFPPEDGLGGGRTKGQRAVGTRSRCVAEGRHRQEYTRE